ncbi:MAG: hypothetical protein M1297_07500 [Nitrospirae bacterium]|nr:hypothetical protein [Nitrospirota bacterium]
MNALDPANDPFVKKEQTRQRKIPPGHPYLMKDCEKIKKDKDKNALFRATAKSGGVRRSR